MEILLDMEANHHTLHCTTIGIRKQIYFQEYNLYANEIYQYMLIPKFDFTYNTRYAPAY